MRAIIHNQERQRSSGTALGLRWGMYRTTCAVGTTGRRSMGGLGSTGRGCTRPGVFLRADGRDGNPFLANIQARRQGRFQRFAKGQPHFRKSFRERVAVEATKPREASDYAPNQIGEFRNV